MIKEIGSNTFKKIDGQWHRLSGDGFMWILIECENIASALQSWIVSKNPAFSKSAQMEEDKDFRSFVIELSRI